MSLAATLAAGGMRPASFFPTIKCSNCGNEIEISAMGNHECQKPTESPKPGHAAVGSTATVSSTLSSTFSERSSDAPKDGHNTLSNPYALRPVNSNNFQPTSPSPLQFDSPPLAPMSAPAPQSRQRAPTFGSSQSDQRMPRPALPRINADAANRPFLAPETPISPAASSRSGSSLSSKPPPPMRSMTSPMPRLWDPRPPSPELSANLDCAFPPFPMAATKSKSRRPSASSGRSGRKTPTGSERGPSRSSSRQGHKLADFIDMELKSPITLPGERPGRVTSPPISTHEPNNRRPSNDERQQQESMPLDRRRPVSPEDQADDPPPLPSLSNFDSFQLPPAPKSDFDPFNASQASTSPPKSDNDRKVPPARPARPTDSLTPSLLDTLQTQPVSSISQFPMPPAPRSPVRSQTFPFPDESESLDGTSMLTRMKSEPTLRRNDEERPAPLEPSKTEPSQVLQVFPARAASKNEARMDYRLHDAPPVPVPKSVQVHRAGSFHRATGSESSSNGSVNSLRMTNSTGASPVTSAASSVDAFSPLAQEIGRASEDNELRVAGLNVRNPVKPGMRAEQPKEKSPPQNFARPTPPKDVAASFEESPVIPSSSWPLESPMDPAMKDGMLGETAEEPASSNQEENTSPKTATMDLNFNLSPLAFLSDEYDPYRALTPQAKVEEPAGETLGSGTYFKPTHQHKTSRSGSETPKPTQPKQPQHGRARSKSDATRPLQPPPVPSEPSGMQLQRRPTVGGRSMCRGCGLLIEGKSVKDAGGRLTGRWHKACFVCKTCNEPFPNADFYVLNNNPYCEQHYHEKNRSVCFGCRKGIEGQYLETKTQDQRGLIVRKYHPRCFQCLTCKKTLTDDYFDVAGRVYCETHAHAVARAAPRRGGGPGGSLSSRNGSPLAPHGSSGLRAEKRTTKRMG